MSINSRLEKESSFELNKYFEKLHILLWNRLVPWSLEKRYSVLLILGYDSQHTWFSLMRCHLLVFCLSKCIENPSEQIQICQCISGSGKPWTVSLHSTIKDLYTSQTVLRPVSVIQRSLLENAAFQCVFMLWKEMFCTSLELFME